MSTASASASASASGNSSGVCVCDLSQSCRDAVLDVLDLLPKRLRMYKHAIIQDHFTQSYKIN